MTEETIKPGNLQKGDKFRLTGEAENPEERDDTGIYEVVDLDLKWDTIPGIKNPFLVRCDVLVRRDGGEPSPMGIGPWVPLIRILP